MTFVIALLIAVGALALCGTLASVADQVSAVCFHHSGDGGLEIRPADAEA